MKAKVSKQIVFIVQNTAGNKKIVLVSLAYTSERKALFEHHVYIIK